MILLTNDTTAKMSHCVTSMWLGDALNALNVNCGSVGGSWILRRGETRRGGNATHGLIVMRGKEATKVF